MQRNAPILRFALSALLLLLLCVSAITSAAMQTESTLPANTEAADADLPVAFSRKGGSETFLILGRDRASGLYDVILLARLNPESRAVSLVQIPRDTFADYAERSYRKLNGAASALGGIEGMRDFLSAALGIPIDHYAAIDLDCVGDAVDAIGGVTLDIPMDMDYEDESQGLSIHLKAGRTTLDGDAAEQFLRFRSGYVTADLGRLDAQKQFISAFLAQLKSASLPSLCRTARALYRQVRTDLSLAELLRLIPVALRISQDRLTMLTLPGEATRTRETEGAWYYVLKRQAAFEVVAEHLNPCNEPLSAERFDPLHRFTSAAYPHFEEIYRKMQQAEG